ncbi:MAG: YbaB/EbfC family nucleoid-associated protein [Deltaproteobacteria bacterium]|nr:YbaB/EbfC family nucleoid-associated protein [Deltaproteobacteria bacterium]
MPNFGDLLQSAQQMQQNLARIQQELERKAVEGSAGGGMVKATVNGRHQVLKIEIEKGIVDPDDVGMLEDLVVAAINQAMTKATEVAKEQLSEATGGLPMNIPGIF